MDEVREHVKSVAALVASGPEGRERVNRVIEQQAWPELRDAVSTLGTVENGWWHPVASGNYGTNYRMRTFANLTGIWANSMSEATYVSREAIDGSAHYTMTFPADMLPKSKVRYFWSVIAVDSKDYKVIPNPLKRYLLNQQSHLKYNADGSLTLGFGPTRPSGVPKANWLPTPAGGKYNLTFRYYGPADDVASGQYFPPDLVQQS
jgi:hypothetical protein